MGTTKGALVEFEGRVELESEATGFEVGGLVARLLEL